MKIASLVLALAGSMALTGCSDLVSLNTFVTEKQAVSDVNLPGTWKSDNDLFIIQSSGAGYTITYTDGKGVAQKFTATLFKAGDAELLDLVNETDAFLQIPVHAAVRVWAQGTELRWTFLDSKWLREQASQYLASQPAGDGMLLTSPGDAVRAFLIKYGGDSKAYENSPNVMTRLQ